jgi:hypothetical protein
MPKDLASFQCGGPGTLTGKKVISEMIRDKKQKLKNQKKADTFCSAVDCFFYFFCGRLHTQHRALHITPF